MRKLSLLFALIFALTFIYSSLTLGQSTQPLRQIPGINSLTFWERTGGDGPAPFTFSVNSTQLQTKSFSNPDFIGVSDELYDVFYSNADGSLNIDGSYVTIECSFGREFPSGGGLNIAEVGLNIANRPVELANVVASFVALGNNAIPGSVGNATDKNLQTHTTMGNTVGQSQRLRLTLGFASSSGAPSGILNAPTLSEWGTILVAVLILAAGTYFIRRTRNSIV